GPDASHFFAHLFWSDETRLESPFSTCRAHGQLAARCGRQLHGDARGHIDRKRSASEWSAAHTDRAEVLTPNADGGRSREKHEARLAGFEVALDRAPGGQVEALEPHVTPTGALGSDAVYLRRRGRKIRFDEERGAHRACSATSRRRFRNPSEA